jgi:hypothetical protein
MSTKKITDDSGTEPEQRPDDPDEISAKKPDNGPLWSDESESRRVRATIWSHPQKAGKTRYTIGICRSYFNERQGKWVNTSFFDRRDLQDVIDFAEEAKKRLARITGEPDPD